MTLQIEQATPHHAPEICAIYAPFVEFTAVSFETAVPTPAEIEQRITTTGSRYPWLVCTDAGQVIGYAYASQHRTRAAYQWSVDVSAYVGESARRKGIARALYTSLLALLRAQGFYNAFAGIALPNAASVGFHEAQGFTPLGIYRSVGYKLGAWHDVGWWQRILQPPATEPAEPNNITALVGSAAWDAALAEGLAHLRGG